MTAPMSACSFGAPASANASATTSLFSFGVAQAATRPPERTHFSLNDTYCPMFHVMEVGRLDPAGSYNCDRCKSKRPTGEMHYQCRACDYDVCVVCKPVYRHQKGFEEDHYDLKVSLREQHRETMRKFDAIDTALVELRRAVLRNTQSDEVFTSALNGIAREVREMREEIRGIRVREGAAPPPLPYLPPEVRDTQRVHAA
jgi:hypothetical protein